MGSARHLLRPFAESLLRARARSLGRREDPAGLCASRSADQCDVRPGRERFPESEPELARDAINVSCDGRRLTEVRICMTKELAFRSCPEMARYSCRRDKVVMP